MRKINPNRDDLIERYRSYAHALAHDFIGRIPAQVDKNDVFGYAELGLVEAATTFNADAGVHFKTFAYYRVRGAIYDGLRLIGGLPREFYRQMKFERAATACIEERSTSAAPDTTSGKYAELKNATGSILSAYFLSLDAMPLEPADSVSGSPDQRYQTSEMAQQIRDAVTKLPDMNRRVIEDYYFREANLEEIAERLGLSKSWVCRLHARGIEMLKVLLDAPSVAERYQTCVGAAR